MEPAAAVYFVCSLCVIEFARKAIFRRSRSGPGNLLAQIVDRKQRRCPKTGSLLPPLAAYRLFPLLFHSTQDPLRHSSTTYKLKLNHGDLKATQGDTGHAEIDMITSIYAHILDEDRKVNAQKFETAFYAKPDLRNVRPPEEPAKSESATLDLESLVAQLQKSPELASALAALIAAQAPAK